MILLDTNVVSEPSRLRPDQAVQRWIDAQAPGSLFLCAPVLAELRYGLERLPPSGRRERLEQWLRRIEQDVFADRILPLEQSAAHEFGRIYARRTEVGRPIGVMDALIAAIAISHRAAIATRDVHDFADLDLDVIDPFRAPLSAP